MPPIGTSADQAREHVSRHFHRDGLLTYVLTVDPQWDGSVMVHTDIEARDDPGFASSVCIEAPLIDVLIADLIAIRDARPSEPRHVVKIVPARPAQQRRIV